MGHPDVKCCESKFFLWIAVIVGLVGFAGLMAGLTLGLMSLGLVDLEVLSKSGRPQDRIHACLYPCSFFSLALFWLLLSVLLVLCKKCVLVVKWCFGFHVFLFYGLLILWFDYNFCIINFRACPFLWKYCALVLKFLFPAVASLHQAGMVIEYVKVQNFLLSTRRSSYDCWWLPCFSVFWPSGL